MKTKLVLIIFFVGSLLNAGTFQYFPVPVTGAGAKGYIVNMFQQRSQVTMMIMYGDFVPPNVRAATVPIEVNFPTLFVTEVFSTWQYDEHKPYIDSVLYGEKRAGIPTASGYDYDIGNGRIIHPVFGLIEISEYPWVYSPAYGWRYVVEAGVYGGSAAWWFWEENMGWYWTTRNMFPVIVTQSGIEEYPFTPR